MADLSLAFMSSVKPGKNSWTRTSFTKEGIIFIVLCLVVGFAALNTGNNLLYLIFGVMISLVVISGVISLMNLSEIVIQLVKTPCIYALTPHEIAFSLTNRKHLVPSFSLTLELGSRKTYLAYLPAGSTRPATINCFFNARGWNDLPKLTLYTKFPFGFFKKWTEVEITDSSVLVFPNVHKAGLEENTQRDHLNIKKLVQTGHSQELKSIRDYYAYDNVRNIDWKNTAKLNKFMVKEFFNNEDRTAKIVFQPKGVDTEHVERYISHAASLLNEYIKRGFSVDFTAPGKTYKAVCNRSEMNKVLTFLALYQE